MLVIKIKIIININDNKIIIMFWLFGFKVVTLNISIIGLYLEVNNSKKLKQISLILKQEDKYLISQIKSSIIDKLYYDKIIINTQIGLGNAKDTAMSIGIINILCEIIAQFLQLKNSDTKLYFNNLPEFENMKMFIDLEAKVYFTIFDMVFAIILSFYKKGKYVKERK